MQTMEFKVIMMVKISPTDKKSLAQTHTRYHHQKGSSIARRQEVFGSNTYKIPPPKDKSSMTGEIDPIEISRSQNPFLFSGAKVVDGYGRMLVTSVGMNTI
ncbi:hypothetical protein ACFX10_022002 [Malus domestica]